MPVKTGLLPYEPVGLSFEHKRTNEIPMSETISMNEVFNFMSRMPFPVK